MNKYAVILLSLVLLSIASVSVSCDGESVARTQIIRNILSKMMDQPPKELFKIWHHLYEPEYSIASELAVKKYKAFKATLKNIKETNAKGLSYKLGLNQFSDLTKEEFKTMYLTKKPSTPELLNNLNKSDNQADSVKQNTGTKFLFEADDDDDDEKNDDRRRNLQTLVNVNWKSKMTIPRNQKSCGSCWAFATAGAIEGNYNIKYPTSPLKETDYLSTQQFVDCDGNNGGCNGGSTEWALIYAKAGLTLDVNYPYKAVKNTTCNLANSPIKAKVLSYTFCSNYYSTLTKKCSSAIVNGLLAKGPVIVGIDGSVIQSYESGIYDGDSTDPSKTCMEDNHAVVLVGYTDGVATKEVPHFTVRNSWTRCWGEDGHLRVKKSTLTGKTSCFLENEALLPVL